MGSTVLVPAEVCSNIKRSVMALEKKMVVNAHEPDKSVERSHVIVRQIIYKSCT